MKQTKLRFLALFFGLLTVLIGIVVIIGWVFDVFELKSIVHHQTSMKFNSALLMILCGSSIICISIKPISELRQRIVYILTSVVILISVLTLIQFLFQLNLGIDLFAFKDTPDPINPGRMSPTTAFCFLIIAIAMMYYTNSSSQFLRRSIVAALSITVIIISGLIFISLIPNLMLDTHFLGYTNMSIHSSILFILLGCSLLSLLINEGNFVWSLNAFITSAAVAWLLLFLATSSSYFQFANQMKKNGEKIIQNQKVIKELGKISTTLVFLDSSEYGHLTTNNKKDLENQKIYQNEVELSLNNADQIIENNTPEQLMLDNLKRLINYKYKIAASNVSNFQKEDINHKLYHALNQLQNSEDQLFKQREEKQNFITYSAFLIAPLGVFLNIAMLLIGLFILNYSLIERKKIIAKEKQLAEIESSNAIIDKDLKSDFTDKKQGRIQSQSSQKMVEFGQLTSGIAYDFNNLLASILENLHFLEQITPGNKKANEHIQNALRAASQGTNITKQLLAFAKLQKLTPKPTSLEESINHFIKIAKPLYDSSFQIVPLLDKSIPFILIDPVELENTLIILAENAKHAMPNGGKLIISTKLIELGENNLTVQEGIKPGSYACISVTDTGEGMSPEMLEHIFEPFFNIKDRELGAGMGLSIVYGFVKQSGGTVEIYSELERGTTVSLYFPVAHKNTDL